MSCAVFGDLQLSEVSAESEVVRRTARLASANDNNHYAITVQRQGSYRISHDGRDTVIGPGDFTIYDCTRPWEMRFASRHSTLVALVPRSALPFSPREIQRVTATSISGRFGMGALLRPLLLQLAEQPHQYGEVAPRVSTIAFSLITTLFGELLGGGVGDQPTERDCLLWRIKAHIETHLGDPALSPGTVAAAHHISLRTLHNLFRDEEMTVGMLIRHRRLELADPLLARDSIGVIAERHGLVNRTYFSRLFRSYYGISPTELRANTADDAPQC